LNDEENKLTRQIVEEGALVSIPTSLGARLGVLGMPITHILSGMTVNISVESSIPIVGTRYVISDDVASLVSIIDVKVGVNSQFHTMTGELPGEIFSSKNSNLMELALDTTINIGQLFTVTVRNISTEPITFRSALMYKVIETI
jgi:hypothetical protein